MKKYLLLLVLTIGFQKNILAQQEPYFSTYYINPSVINTSLSALNDNNNVVFIYRNQWSNYQPTSAATSTNFFGPSDSPNTGILSLNLKSRDKIYSFGVNLISDHLGPQEVKSFSPYFGIKKKINNSFISIGVSPVFINSTIHFDNLIFVDSSDPFNVGGKEKSTKADVGVGVSYFNNKLLLSLGVKNIVESSFDYENLYNVNKAFRNFNFLGKYSIEIDRDLRLEPFILFRTDLSSFTFDVSTLATYKENLIFGASYRYDEAVVGFLGHHFLEKKKMFIGYSLDYVLHNKNAKSGTSHEFVLRYDLPTPQLKKPIRTPRFIY